MSQFDFEQARTYWKYAPSGMGKVDTSTLLDLPDEEFMNSWNKHFQSRLRYYWEDRHFVSYFCKLFQGKKILSFGSGMGHNEIQFLQRGAQLTCADIVPSNLKVIERVCQLKGLKNVSFLLMDDSSQADFGTGYDVVFARGSLMTMPFPLQKKVMLHFKKSLQPDGQIILNLYTRKFMEDTCGTDSPTEFARASDPSVGDCHNPWSEWHDDEKIQELSGQDIAIVHKQLWNQEYYVWYALQFHDPSQPCSPSAPFLDLPSLEEEICNRLYVIPLQGWQQVEADLEITPDGSMVCRTSSNQFHYASVSPLFQKKELTGDFNSLQLDVTLEEGGISIGILDHQANQWFFSRPIVQQGRHYHVFEWERNTLPACFQIIFSNNQPHKEAPSYFAIHRLALGDRQ